MSTPSPTPTLKPPTGASHLNITAGLLVATGGIMGYIKKKSLPSLIAGSVIGAGYLGSAYMINSTKDSSLVNTGNGFAVGTVTSSVLVAAMLPRFIKSRAVMPAGLCSLIGLSTLAYNGKQAKEWLL